MIKHTKFFLATGIAFGLVLLIALVYGILVPDAMPNWIGIKVVVDANGDVVAPAKTLWDLLDLLIIPFALAVVAYLFNISERQREEERADNRNQQETLNNYIKQLSELILEKNLLTKGQESRQASVIARSLTRATLFNVNSSRKATIMRFLVEAGLVDKEKTVLSLAGADFRKANLHRANLKSVNLSNVNLMEANLDDATLENSFLANINLSGAFLRNTNFMTTDLKDAILKDADLTNANFRDAKLTKTNLRSTTLNGAKLKYADLTGIKLDGAQYSNATEWPNGFDPQSLGAILKD